MKKLSLLLSLALTAPTLVSAGTQQEAPLNCEVVSVIQGERSVMQLTSLAVSMGDDPYKSIPALRESIETNNPYQKVRGTIRLENYGQIKAEISANNNGHKIKYSESSSLSEVREQIREDGTARLAFTGYGYILCK